MDVISHKPPTAQAVISLGWRVAFGDITRRHILSLALDRRGLPRIQEPYRLPFRHPSSHQHLQQVPAQCLVRQDRKIPRLSVLLTVYEHPELFADVDQRRTLIS